ncbi:MAG: hypothetical protein CM1200mP15_03540 [Dehalococcoidia bacterium]|nr:MAG: hypothetical protein CM1200mP15_03540 [Dehalococcoidia bacterium]
MAADHNQDASEVTQPDFSHLTQKSQEFLETVCGVLSQYSPEMGAMKDYPRLRYLQIVSSLCVSYLKILREIDLAMLHCLTCVDYESHLEMVYFLHSMGQEEFLVIKADVPSEALEIQSVTKLWAAANWYEREAHDLFGVAFSGNSDLSPLLLYDEFEGHPGRKEYDFHEYQEF